MLGVEPSRTPWDLNFSIVRVPVRVHPMFWLAGLLLGMHSDTAVELAGWMIAVFVSILVHELGHAAAMRAYGYDPSITLYALGGYTAYGPSTFLRQPGGLAHIAISAAGPAAGFALAGLLLGALVAARVKVAIAFGFPFGVLIGVREVVWSEAFSGFLNDLFFVNVFWGLVNLLPIYPLDGGQISREVLTKVNSAEGARWSLMISFTTAGLIAVTALVKWGQQGLLTALFFGYLAYVSYASLASYSGRGRW